MNLKLFKKVCEESGAPGFEKRVRELVQSEIANCVDECYTDNMGSLICLKKGSAHGQYHNKKIMVSAHMDEIGFIVKHIDEKGFIRFHTLGGFDPKTLTAQRVIVHGKKDLIGVMGCKPIHVMEPEERNKPAKINDFFIDLGLSKEEVDKYISIGDPVTRERDFIEMGNCVNCKSIDNRVAVFILITVLQQLKDKVIPFDLYAVFSTQEEVGLRGANVAAHAINPDFGIAIDTTIAYDLPGAAPHEYVTSLGDGTAIKIMDASAICDTRMVRFMKETANAFIIKWQPEILTAGGTDTAGVQQRGKNGAIAGAISIPTRNLHQVIEMCNKSDVQASIDLLEKCLQTLDKFDYKY